MAVDVVESDVRECGVADRDYTAGDHDLLQTGTIDECERVYSRRGPRKDDGHDTSTPMERICSAAQPVFGSS